MHGHCQPEGKTEIVNIRCEAIGIRKKPRIPEISKPEKETIGVPAPDKMNLCIVNGKKKAIPFYLRNRLPPGTFWQGPAIVAEYSATTYMPADCMGRIDSFGNLWLELKE
jgi:N-methylhydantoinase A